MIQTVRSLFASPTRRRWRATALVALVCLLLSSLMPLPALTALTARAAPSLDFAEIDQFIAGLMDMYRIPGVGVALVKEGRIVYAKGHGYAKVPTSEPATENTVFAIGSITKSFTALAVAQLVDAGLVDLDKPIIEYIPEFKLKDPEATRTVTVRHALSHMTGLPRADELWNTQAPASRKQVIEDMAKIEPTAKPGEQWQYNNQNFALAGYLVERVTGQSWEEYTRQFILEPLGMTSVTFDTRAMVKRPDYALPHKFTVRNGPQPMPLESTSFRAVVPLGPAGSIAASALDMARYARFQLGDGTVDGRRLLSARMMKEMHRVQATIDGGQAGAAGLTSNIGYGLGWITETYQGYSIVQHNGSIDGFSANVSLVPAEGVGVVLLTNYNLEGLFIEAARFGLLDRLLGLKLQDHAARLNANAGFSPSARWQQVLAARSYQADPKQLESYQLMFDSPIGKLEIAYREGRLVAISEAWSNLEIDLVPFDEGKFFAEFGSFSSLSVVTITRDERGTSVFFDNAQIAFLPAEDSKSAAYADPQGRFSVTLPPDFEREAGETPPTFLSNDKTVRIRVDAAPAEAESAAENAKAWLATFREGFDQRPLSVNTLPPIEGIVWTQVVYVLPDGLVVAVITTTKEGTAYFIGIEGQQAALARLQGAFINLVTSFKIAK